MKLSAVHVLLKLILQWTGELAVCDPPCPRSLTGLVRHLVIKSSIISSTMRKFDPAGVVLNGISSRILMEAWQCFLSASGVTSSFVLLSVFRWAWGPLDYFTVSGNCLSMGVFFSRLFVMTYFRVLHLYLFTPMGARFSGVGRFVSREGEFSALGGSFFVRFLYRGRNSLSDRILGPPVERFLMVFLMLLL